MLKQQQEPQVRVKEETAARAVLRDAVRFGHDCIELGRDGKRPIFFCRICHTRCYNDASLWDHLRGNLHARRKIAVFGISEEQSSGKSDDFSKCSDQSVDSKRIVAIKTQKSSKMQIDPGSLFLAAPMMASYPEISLRLLDEGQMFFKVRPCSGKQFVEAYWLEKRVLVKKQQDLAENEYGIVVFPYSDGLGRGVYTEKEKANPSLTVVNEKKKGTRGRKRTKQADRICFICRQKMIAGKEVATLLNLNNKRMMCHSRNWLGAFHVYHTSCLISWILIYDAKFWMGQSLNFSRNFRKSLMNSVHGPLDLKQQQEKPIFCPECQGTGFRFQNGHLEPPRYRLAQIFDWVLELVQARKVWIDHLGQDITGLMFHVSKGICHPRDFESSLVLLRGTLRFYTTGEDSKVEQMQIDGAIMDVDA